MPNDVVIKVEGVSKKFCRSLKRSMLYGVKDITREIFGIHNSADQLRRDEFWAVNDVSFEVRRGECFGIIGPNGAGKSTLLKMLSGLILPDKGKITLRGRVGALLEIGAGFHTMLTGRENIYISGAILGQTKKEIDRKFDQIVAFAELEEFIDAPVKHYSSGMFVRLGFAVAVHTEPDILLVDEALAVGDIGFQQKCLHHIETLQERGATMVVVAHDIQMIKNYCTSAVYLKAGEISFQGYPETATELYLKDIYEHRQLSLDGKRRVVLKRATPGRTTFGTSHGEIFDASLWRGEEETNVFSQGEMLKVKVAAWVDDSVVNPEIVLQLRDLRGYALYGIDSLSAGLAFPQGERQGGMIQVEFTFEVSLVPGQYAIALGLNDHVSDAGVILLEKLIGSLTFTVLEGFKKFHGAVDLKARCERLPFSPEYVQRFARETYDIDEGTLARCAKQAPAPQILASLVRVSRQHFGFFSKHLPRMFEYPWLLSKMGNMSHKSVLDIGTGVSPLPLLLAEHGVEVTTVDNSPVIRDFGDWTDGWNEWGFFDYSVITKNIRSIHDDILVVPLEDHSFDCIYSVSVIEHMPASARPKLWRKVAQWLGHQGTLLLTTDLFPGSDRLWNYCQGELVDTTEAHGDLEILEGELSQAGFKLVEKELLRDLPNCRVDVALMHLERK